jgi:hypothetical protein
MIQESKVIEGGVNKNKAYAKLAWFGGGNIRNIGLRPRPQVRWYSESKATEHSGLEG